MTYDPHDYHIETHMGADSGRIHRRRRLLPRQHPLFDRKRELRYNYIGLDGRISLSELNRWAEENNIPDKNKLMLNFPTMVWVDNATEEELAAFDKKTAQQEAARLEYRRKHYEELKKEFGDA